MNTVEEEYDRVVFVWINLDPEDGGDMFLRTTQRCKPVPITVRISHPKQ
jgi:hypothetical protein